MEKEIKMIVLFVVGIIFISGCIQDYSEDNEEDDEETEDEEEEPEEIDTTILWESMNGPPGGKITKLIQSPYHHNELYAATERCIYKSEDKGESWEIMNGSQDSEVNSIALFGDRLFFGGNGVFYYGEEENLVRIYDDWCKEVIVSDNKLFLTFDHAMPYTRLLYSDFTSEDFNWKDISPSESELSDLILPLDDSYGIRIPNIVALGNRILANVIVNVDGSGEYTNGHLYISEDLGETWSKVDFGMDDDIIIANIIQDSDNSEHIFLLFRHNVMHEYTSPVSELLKESYDGGETWSPVTDIAFESNGITDIDAVGSVYYLLSPWDGCILKLDGSSYEEFGMPRVSEFGELTFDLDTLLFDFDDPNIVYGKTGNDWSFGLLKSEDKMETWKKIDKDIIESSPTIIKVHPTDPDVILTSSNIIQESYCTRDGGNTWEPFTPVSGGDEVKIDPHNPNHILLIDENTDIYESYDQGRTFENINQDFSSAKILDFEIAEDSGTIYVSNNGVGISKYDSLQEDWQYLTNSPDYAYDIEIDPEDSGITYATYSPKIFENHSSIWRYSKHQNENSGWSEIFRVEDSPGITSIKFDPQNPDRIYAGVIGKEGEIYVSNDKGNTWQKFNDELTFTTVMRQAQLKVHPTDKNIVYAGTWMGGTYKSIDGGKNWVKLENAPQSPTGLAIYDKNPDIIYASERIQPVIHKSEDGGQTWREYYRFDSPSFVSSAVEIDPNDPDTIYAGAFDFPFAITGPFVKIMNGTKVADLDEGMPGMSEGLPCGESVVEIEVDPNNPNTIYVAKHGYGLFKTIDGGVTWERLDDQGTGLPRLGYYDIDVDYSDSNTLYATGLCELLPEYIIGPTGLPYNIEQGAAGVYKSTDQGATWTRILETETANRAIEVDPQNPNVLYVASRTEGIFVSSDGGQTWHQENDDLPSLAMTSVVAMDGYIYASIEACGVYAGIINDDYSITWDKSRSNKPKAYVYNIQIGVDPLDSNRIYVTANPGGMIGSDDGGRTWTDRNVVTPSIVVDDPFSQGYCTFDIDPNNPANVWMGVYGKGMFKSYEYMYVSFFANGDNNEMFRKHITDVVVDPGDSNTIYASSEEGVFVTKDGGHTWEEMNDGLETLNVRSLKVVNIEWPPLEDDFEDGNADGWDLESGWSTTQENGNYILQGVGHNWALTGSDSWTDYAFESKVKLVEGQVHVNYRRSNAGRYFIGVSEGTLSLSRTTFGKEESVHTQLKSVNMAFAKNKWYTIKIIGKGNNIKVYVDNVLKINYTDDEPLLNGKIAFESLPDSKIYIDDIAVTIVSIDSILYAGTGGYGVYEFNPTSKKWQNLGKSFGGGWWSPWERRMYQFSSLLFDPDVPGKVYYGHFPSGFFISEDNGHTWSDSSLGLGNDGMFSLTMHPHNHSILFAGTYNGVVKSVDGGETWELKSNGMPSEQWPYTVAIDNNNTNIMYTSTKNGQNKGFCDRNDFCGVVMKSTDGGESWFKIMNGLDDESEFYTLLIYPLNHSILFLSTSLGVYVSRDAGDSWKLIINGLPTRHNHVRDNVADNLALTPDNKYLILGLVLYGVWKADLSEFIASLT